MKDFPKIAAKNIILSQLTSQDIPKIVEYADNIKIAEMTLNIPHPYEEEDAIFWLNMANQGFIDKSQYTFAIRDKSSGAFMGGIGLIVEKRFDRADMGYWLAEQFWNKGYTSEAVGVILKFGFEEIGLRRISAQHLIENPASGKVMIKNGMVEEGEFIDFTKKGEDYKSVKQYRMTKPEYENLSR